MRKFQVTVNGQTYEVEVEEISDGQASAPAARPAPVSAAPAAKPAPKEAPRAAGAGDPVKAPMPGNILSVAVKPGDKVTNGQTLMILEAMKMENPIPAPRDGVITSVLVDKGMTVESAQVLVTLQ